MKYGLRILFSDIEDYPHNETRFAVIGHHEAPRSGTDKTAIMFKVPNNPGSARRKRLDVFKQNKLNLTWIESFPAKTGKNEYMFFVDFEGHVEDPKVKRFPSMRLQEHCEQPCRHPGFFPHCDRELSQGPGNQESGIRAKCVNSLAARPTAAVREPLNVNTRGIPDL